MPVKKVNTGLALAATATVQIKYGTKVRPRIGTVLARFPGRMEEIRKESIFGKGTEGVQKAGFKDIRFPAVTALLSCTESLQSKKTLQKWEEVQVATLGI